MAVNAGFYVVGANELRAAMQAASVDPDALKNANAKVSTFVAGAAKIRAPLGDSGALIASIRGTRQIGRAVVRAGTAKVPYAGSVHYGWPGRPNPQKGWRGGPYPGAFYIIDAAQETEQLWLEEYIRDVQAIIDQITSSTPTPSA